MENSLKAKFKRLLLTGFIFLVLSLIGISISLISISMQTHLQTTISVKLMQPDLSAFSKFMLSQSSEEQKTYLVVGIMLGVMSGFCLAAASAVKRKGR